MYTTFSFSNANRAIKRGATVTWNNCPVTAAAWRDGCVRVRVITGRLANCRRKHGRVWLATGDLPIVID